MLILVMHCYASSADFHWVHDLDQEGTFLSFNHNT